MLENRRDQMASKDTSNRYPTSLNKSKPHSYAAVSAGRLLTKKTNKPQNNTICRSPLSIVAFFFVDEGKTLLIENKYNCLNVDLDYGDLLVFTQLLRGH